MVSHVLNRGNGVETNARRAELVERGRFSGLARRAQAQAELSLSPWPVARPRDGIARVNRDFRRAQLESIRTSVDRGRPLGDEAWGRRTAERLELEFTLRGPGRPRRKTYNQ
jgi:putative transposase